MQTIPDIPSPFADTISAIADRKFVANRGQMALNFSATHLIGSVGGFMARTASVFRQSDLTRAIKAARGAGMGVSRVEIGKDGAIVLVAVENTRCKTT